MLRLLAQSGSDSAAARFTHSHIQLPARSDLPLLPVFNGLLLDEDAQ